MTQGRENHRKFVVVTFIKYFFPREITEINFEVWIKLTFECLSTTMRLKEIKIMWLHSLNGDTKWLKIWNENEKFTITVLNVLKKLLFICLFRVKTKKLKKLIQ